MSALDLSIDSTDVIRLIESHLTECGLHEACKALREESGIKAAGSSHTQWKAFATCGDWGWILANLATIEATRMPSKLLSDVQEIAILELADGGDVQLAYATLRLVASQLDAQTNKVVSVSVENIPKSRQLEQQLAALSAMRSAKKLGLPKDYYGEGAISKQERRDELGRLLMESIPQIPSSRLTSLIQQAIKWQAHTGQLPVIKQHWSEEEGGQPYKSKKRQKKFDLVLGESAVAASKARSATKVDEDLAESIPTKVYSTISFGKKATAEVAVFLPDGSGLATGSSDGLVEIWSSTSRYKELRMDLPYQQSEELIGHDDTIITAITVSNDGAMLATGDANGLVKVWKIDNGKCLREVAAHPNASISCIDFSHDASHILTASHQTTCREYGLRTNRMLKEFRGHTSFVNTCRYMIVDDSVLRVVTGSADGTARVWDGKSSEILYVLRPFSNGRSLTEVGTSIVQKMDAPNVDGCPNLHSVIPLHTPPEAIVLVPRGHRAFLVSLTGVVLRTFSIDAKSIFVVATVSPSNQWLYTLTDGGALHVFDTTTGEEEMVMKNFADETCGQSKAASPEITAIAHHPHKGILSAFSNDKSQKRGVITLWK